MLHSLLQLTPKKMKFQVTKIEFDFETDDEDDIPSEDYQQQLTEKTIGQIWEAEDEDDLVEEITCATGWCIKSLDYRHVLS
jgi:mannosyltransferase OCH1-like enzyme